MKTATLTAACLTLLISAPEARADHRVFRTLDDLAFAALQDVREARWEIHDHFNTSRDFNALLEDAGELTHALRDIQDAAYREDRPERLSQLIHVAHDALLHFQEHAEHADFASRGHGSFEYSGGGYSFRSSRRHGGNVHVEELQQFLSHLDSHLHEMEQAMDRAFGHGHHHDGPAVPGGGAPGSPVVAPGPSAEAFSFPLLGGRFRIRLN